MADLDAILASMAAKTGNVLVQPVERSKEEEKKSKLALAKRQREPQELPTDGATGGIWNPTVQQELPDALLRGIAKRAATFKISPSMEIARQQVVRLLCQKIIRAGEDLGINKLPNSALETWQFTSSLTVAEVDPLIPHASSDNSGLMEELVKAGASRNGAKKKCEQLTKEADKQLRKFKAQAFDYPVAATKTKRVKVTTDDHDMRVLTYGHTSVKLSQAHYAKLRMLYDRHNDDSDHPSPSGFDAAAFALLLRYDSLDGGGFQAALNEECFDVLLRRFGCQMECFASPLNCRYGRFGSAFLDTDAAFGSVGSFFEFTPRAGSFEANPPFIPKLIKRMADHMTALLDAADGALMFVVVIPAWQQTDGWQLLRKSRFNQHHLLIAQQEHGYCEGKQQIRKTRWRIASFDTSVFFWQNAKAKATWPVTQTALEELKLAFQSKQADEREARGLRNSGKRVRRA